MFKALLPLVLVCLLFLGCEERVVIIATPTPIPLPTPTPAPEPRYVPDLTPITGAFYESPIASKEGFSFQSTLDPTIKPPPPKCPLGTPIPFDESTRRQIFQAIVLAQDFAQNESEKTGVHWEEYETVLYAMILDRFGITIQQLHCIGREGNEYWWPLPPEPNFD